MKPKVVMHEISQQARERQLLYGFTHLCDKNNQRKQTLNKNKTKKLTI